MTIRHTEHQRHDTPARSAAAAEPKRPWLSRLLASKRGNVLPILAASILPMAAMIGGAVDMSRAYMVKSRIQHACDAGVLAGRRAMAAGNYTDAAKAQAQDFFDINYKAGYNGSPMRAHLSAGNVRPEHFEIWLALFDEVLRRTLPPWSARAWSQMAHRIGQGLRAGVQNIDAGRAGPPVLR